MVAKAQKIGAGHGYAVLPKAIAAALFCISAVSSAVAGTDCWTYHPPASGTRGTISWTDSSGFENVINGIILSDGQIRIYPNYNKNSTTLKNADFSIPVRDEDGGELAYSPDFLAGKDDTGQAILGYINGLTNIIVNANATRIGNYAFKTNPNLVRVRLNDGLKSIGTEGFNECEALETVENFFPDSLEALGSKAFYGCKALAGNMTANGLQSIEARAFRSCQSLRTIDCGNSSVTVFQDYIFFDCPKLGSAILPKTLRTMGIGVFEGCSSLTNVTPLLPPRLETLGTDSTPVFINDPIHSGSCSVPADVGANRDACLSCVEDRDFYGGKRRAQVDWPVCVLPELQPHEYRSFRRPRESYGGLGRQFRHGWGGAAHMVSQPARNTPVRSVV